MAQIYDAIILGKVNPFRSTSVGDPWQAEVIDVQEINKKPTRAVLETLDEVRSTGRSDMCMLLSISTYKKYNRVNIRLPFV